MYHRAWEHFIARKSSHCLETSPCGTWPPGRITVGWEKTMSEVLTPRRAIKKISKMIKDIRIAMLSSFGTRDGARLRD